jgi:hypothetical protein
MVRPGMQWRGARTEANLAFYLPEHVRGSLSQHMDRTASHASRLETSVSQRAMH